MTWGLDIICPECKAVQPRVQQVDDAAWEAGEEGFETCVSCGHVFKPDTFEQLTLRCEKDNVFGGGSPYYDRNGLPIPIGEWARRIESDENYKRVALTNFGPVAVSTVWLGLDHNFGGGPPLIFETMIFFVETDERWSSNDEKHELAGEQWRWHTLEEAIAGHETVVQHVKDYILPPEAEEWIKAVITEVYRVE